MQSRCSIKHTNSIIAYLDRYLTMPISNPIELFSLIESIEKGKRHFTMGVRDLLKFYEAFSLMEDEKIMKFRKVVKIPQTNVDNYIPEDAKLILAFNRLDNENYRIVFRLLTYSGIRLIEAIYLLNNYDAKKMIRTNEIAKYPLNLVRKTKKVYYAYIPNEFTKGLRRIKLSEDSAKKNIIKSGIPSKYIRKWNYNFLISNGVPEGTIDFLQGRVSSSVGSLHYLSKVHQADLFYAKITSKLLNIL